MESKKSNGRTILAHVVLIILAFLCLFFFYILIINATRSHAQLQLLSLIHISEPTRPY